MPKIVQHIRGRTGPHALQYWDRLGSILVAAEDPEGHEIPEEVFKAIFLPPSEQRHLIRATDWDAWLNLCIHMLGKVDSKVKSPDYGQEVSCGFFLPRGQKELEIWIPTQRTGGASVDIDYTKPLRNIVTGKEYPNLPDMEDAGFIKVGGCHSHNTMGAFFSGTDDKNEMPQPGYHMVVGGLKETPDGWTYTYAVSITANNRRFKQHTDSDGKTVDLELKDFVLPYNGESTDFHASVIDLVDWTRPVIISYPSRTNWDDDGMLGFYTGQGDKGMLCMSRSCWGRVLKDGACNQCSRYHPDLDTRPQGIINLEKSLRPFYDRDGDLVGYVYPGKDGSIAIGPRDMARIQSMHGWDKNGLPTTDLRDRHVISDVVAQSTVDRETTQREKRVLAWNQRPKDSVQNEAEDVMTTLDMSGIHAKHSDVLGAVNMLMRIRDWARDVDKSDDLELVQTLHAILDDELNMIQWEERKEVK